MLKREMNLNMALRSIVLRRAYHQEWMNKANHSSFSFCTNRLSNALWMTTTERSSSAYNTHATINPCWSTIKNYHHSNNVKHFSSMRPLLLIDQQQQQQPGKNINSPTTTTNEQQTKKDEEETQVEVPSSSSSTSAVTTTTTTTGSSTNKTDPTSTFMDKVKELSTFYWNGTKVMSNNFYQAYQLRKQINNRIFRKATRREIMFLNSAYVDFCKFVPFIGLFALPFSTLLIPVIGHFAPAFLPSGYQRPAFLESRRKKHTARRREMSQILNQEFLRLTSSLLNRRDMAEYHLEVSLLQAIIQRVREERARGDDYIQVSCKVLEDLVQFERENGLFQSEFTLEDLSDEVIKNMSLFALASRSEYGGVSGGTSTKYGSSLTLGLFSFSMSTAAQPQVLGFIRVPRKLRMKALRKYVQMIRADDELIADFSVYNLKPKEVQQALYVRGFNVYGDRKFSINELQELLKSWIDFSRNVKTETLFLLAPAVLWWN